MSKDVDAIDYLTPGSVWTWKKKGKVMQSTVVCVTNEHVKESAQDEFPSVVVYLDSKGRFCSRQVEDFLENRQFYNVNPFVEENVNLIEYERKPSEDQETELETEEEQDSGKQADLESVFAGNSEAEDIEIEESIVTDVISGIKFLGIREEDQDYLELAQTQVATYMQRPDFQNNVLIHELMFLSSFDIKPLLGLLTDIEEGGLDSFALDGAIYHISTVLGDYPMRVGSDNYRNLMLASQLQYDGPIEESEKDSEEIEVEVVPVSESPFKESNDITAQLQASIVKGS